MMQDQSLSITTASWTLGSLCIVIVAVRLYTRALVTRQLGWDDFFIALSLLSAIICSALAQVAVYYGLGMHTSDINNPGHRTQAAKYTVIAPNFSVVSTTTGKIFVAIFLLRLMGRSASPWQYWYLYILTLVSVIWNVFAIIAIIGFYLCEERDSERHAALTLPLAFNAFADLALALFPVWIFRKVQLARYKKIGIIIILGAGIFGDDGEMYSFTKSTGACRYNMSAHLEWILEKRNQVLTRYRVLGSHHDMVFMYVIIVCATLPTLPQAYAAILHKRPSYYDTSHNCSGKSEPKHPSIRLQRLPDASLFETVAAEERGSSQENILDKDGEDEMRIQKTTENPFRGSRGVSLSKN
ncbi:hypothetical protein BDW67DRAFT_194344 [Aspergillus spinulosporus]